MVLSGNSDLVAQTSFATTREISGDLQLALAIATPAALRSLLSDCMPALVSPEQVDQVEIQVGLPLADGTLDGLIRFERVHCLLSGKTLDTQQRPLAEPDYQQSSALTLYHSTLKTFCEGVCPQTALAILTHVGYSTEQADAILHLPRQAWHKTWWWQLNGRGYLAEPFYRWMRLRNHPSGTLTLQYQDYYPETCPPYFYSEIQQVPVVTRSPGLSFAETLANLNRARAAFETHLAILLTDPLSDLETEGFIRQNVSLYTLKG
ncbi:MAG: hypothetical protein AAF152_19505 [Cyanobacteria bacterium P01_A01_bin.114]